MDKSPLGRARHKAHMAFDPIWHRGILTRKQAYDWLGRALNWRDKVHIGECTKEECFRIVELCRFFK
jgi:hypothetical protein